MRGATLLALALLLPRGTPAQAAVAPRLAVEARLDGIFASAVTTTHLGLGLTRRASRNLELQAVMAGGISIRDGQSDRHASARGDLFARFAPAPSSPNRWAAYAAGGVSTIVERGARGRAVLALLIGARGRRAFIEGGLGGGLRLGAGVRL